jgi:3-dehydro-L-gulonate 2-dehydrogenase
MNRAINLAKEFEIGCVALRNTNHWLRAGNYGWLAAENGCIGFCCTNTIPNMPPWGGIDPRIGNNPVVISVPGPDGDHLVLDMATSQYAYGKLNYYALEGKELPWPGGFNTKGELTTDPVQILESQRVLPIGLWKGSGLTMMIDLLVSILSAGNATREIGQNGREYGLSQLIIAFSPSYPNAREFMFQKRNELIEYIRSSRHAGTSEILNPGERTLITRKYNMENGIPVNDKIWSDIKKLELRR